MPQFEGKQFLAQVMHLGKALPPCLTLRVRFFGMIQIRINDPRSLGSWCIKGTDESALVKASSVPLMHNDPSDLGALILIWIIPKKRTLSS